MKSFTAFTLALLTAPAIHAGESSSLGVQATVSQPSGDLGEKGWMDRKLGYGIGVHALVDLGGGGAIVPRIDYTLYENKRNGNLIDEDAKAKILSGGADFQFYFSGEASKGFYILGGLGYARGEFNSSYSSIGLALNTSATKGALYFQGGLGVHFTPHIGIECRYQSLQFKDVETTVLGFTAKQDVSCPSLQASLVLRF